MATRVEYGYVSITENPKPIDNSGASTIIFYQDTFTSTALANAIMLPAIFL